MGSRWRRFSATVQPGARPGRVAPHSRRLAFELLEDRHLLSVGIGCEGRSADEIPLAVIGTAPELSGTLAPLSSIDVTFSKPIDPDSFATQDIGLLDLGRLDVSLLGFFGGRRGMRGEG